MSHIATYALWWSQPIVMLALVVSMRRSGLREQYPLFFAYAFFQVVEFAAMLPLMRYDYVSYFIAHWLFEFLEVFLSIAVLFEIYSKVFEPYPALKQIGSLLFHGSTAMLVLVAVVAAAEAPGKDISRTLTAGYAFSESAALVRAGQILVLIGVGIFFRLHWPHHAFGIALGFGLNLILGAVAVMVRRRYGQDVGSIFPITTLVGFNVAMLIWSRYFLLSRKAVWLTPFARADLERWDAELAGILR